MVTSHPVGTTSALNTLQEIDKCKIDYQNYKHKSMHYFETLEQKFKIVVKLGEKEYFNAIDRQELFQQSRETLLLAIHYHHLTEHCVKKLEQALNVAENALKQIRGFAFQLIEDQLGGIKSDLDKSYERRDMASEVLDSAKQLYKDVLTELETFHQKNKV